MTATLTPPPMAPVAPALPTPPNPAPPAQKPLRMPIRLGGRVTIPATVVDFDSFREWRKSDDYPEKLKTDWIDGTLWVDIDMEQGYTHNDIKLQIASVLRALTRAARSGRYFTDGMLLTMPPTQFATGPDGLYASFDAFDSQRLVEVPNSRNVGVIELEGVADMVLEVVSDSSTGKDNNELPTGHHRAGTREYWRVDARRGLRFEILRREPNGWQPTQLTDGWWHSDVFGRDFQMRQEADRRGRPEFWLDVR